jgi:hypothetical protein
MNGSLTASCVTNKWSLTDTGNVIDISPTGSYILVGCQNGDYNVFKFNIY